MAISRSIPSYILAVSAPVWAALYGGMVTESKFGAGVDSVRISLLGGSETAHSDSTGRFAFTPATSSRRAVQAVPGLAWRAASRTIAWNGSPGRVSITITDAGGRNVRGFVSADPAGSYRVEGMNPGIYFASVRAGGRKTAWKWFEGGGIHPGTNSGFSASRDSVYLLAARPGKSAMSARTAVSARALEMDTLLFEKKGFAPFKMAVAGASTGLAVRIERLPIKVLIVDGMSNHDWRQTTRIARAIYAKAGFFSVDVSTAPDKADAAAWQAWSPRFGEYEMVLLNYNSGHGSGSLRWPREREAELEEFVRNGGGLYALHAANNAFSQWAEYNRMIGTGWRSSGFGSALEVDASGRIVRIPRAQEAKPTMAIAPTFL